MFTSIACCEFGRANACNCCDNGDLSKGNCCRLRCDGITEEAADVGPSSLIEY